MANQRFLTLFSIFDQQGKANNYVVEIDEYFYENKAKNSFKKDTNSIGMANPVRLAQEKDGIGHKESKILSEYRGDKQKIKQSRIKLIPWRNEETSMNLITKLSDLSDKNIKIS